MTETETLTTAQQATMIAALISWDEGSRTEFFTTHYRTLLPVELRSIYAAANARPKPMADPYADLEDIGELQVAPCDHGGWRIYHNAARMVLDVEGCWIECDRADLTSIQGDESTTWSHKDLAIAAALATLEE
ncbi:hypothetical protein ACFYY8_31520 [Streptosporangium sp. NPDC001559]|uniref:hypothetical protein n=1 Tax=Streptosporangium sp. NPDC001559 TaxID=3366187 RepID=UPI0036E2A78B